jgi:CTP:molybdopterin cytidylyltransferase MocA
LGSARSIALAILAAGQSRRFGDADKLTAMLHGAPLGLHAARTCQELIVAARAVIVADRGYVLAGAWSALGYQLVLNPAADQGQGTSVATAARWAEASGVDALIIALADMPFVPACHIAALIGAWQQQESGADQLCASIADGPPMPPAIFGQGHFTALQTFRGDSGARALLQTAHVVVARADWLADIDTPEALAAYHGSCD